MIRVFHHLEKAAVWVEYEKNWCNVPYRYDYTSEDHLNTEPDIWIPHQDSHQIEECSSYVDNLENVELMQNVVFFFFKASYRQLDLAEVLE